MTTKHAHELRGAMNEIFGSIVDGATDMPKRYVAQRAAARRRTK